MSEFIEKLFEGAPQEIIEVAEKKKKADDRFRFANKQIELWKQELDASKMNAHVQDFEWTTILNRYNVETKCLEPMPMVTFESQNIKN